MSNHQHAIERKAIRRVKEKKGFYVHLSLFLVISVLLFVINFLNRDFPGDWWFYWPIMGWAIGIGMHYVGVFGLPGSQILTAEWEERELEREIKRLGGVSQYQIPEEETLELREELPENPRPERQSRHPWIDEDFV